MPQSKYFRFGIWIVLLFLIVYLGSLIDWIFTPLIILIQTLFAPILLAGVLYYLFRPIVNLLSRKIPRGLSILILFLSVIALMVGLVFLVGPELQRQFNSLVENWPNIVEQVRIWFVEIQQHDLVTRFQEDEHFSLEEIMSTLETYLGNIMGSVVSNLSNFIGFITNVVIVLVLIPFVLYYMLKEGEKAPNQLLRLLPKKQKHEGELILKDMDTALSSYIQGQILVSICVGVLIYIGYLIIGIEYSLVLGLIAMFTNVIPFLGPWIGTAPAVIVALFDSPYMAIGVIIVVLIVQQFESSFISPQIMGRKLSIHPLTIILLLLVAARFAGFFGMLIAVPTYAVLKVVVSHTYRLLRLRSKLE